MYEISEEYTGSLPAEFVEISLEDLSNHVIKPDLIKDILKNREDNIRHFVVK